MCPRKILILTANPRDTSRLQLDHEVREISIGLQLARHRETFYLEQRWAVQAEDLRRALLDVEPEIVHFSGHGSEGEGLALESDSGVSRLVESEALADLFSLFKAQVKCVILNACYSEFQARAIHKHIPIVIGMRRKIGDRSAIKFAVGFYDALGAGRTIGDAYRFGCNAINLGGKSDHQIPILVRKGVEENTFLQPDQYSNRRSPCTIRPNLKTPFLLIIPLVVGVFIFFITQSSGNKDIKDIRSEFSNDKEGWIARHTLHLSETDRKICHFSGEEAELQYKSNDGNPGGYIEGTDTYQGTTEQAHPGPYFYLAPPEFIDWIKANLGGFLKFDLMVNDRNIVKGSHRNQSPDIILKSHSGTVLFSVLNSQGDPVVNAWKTYYADLGDPNIWRTCEEGESIDREKLLQVFADLQYLGIRGDWAAKEGLAGDKSGIDNVVLSLEEKAK